MRELRQHQRFTAMAMVLNTAFWLWLWIDVFRQLTPYAEHPLAFEEVAPVYKFGAKGLSPTIELAMLSLKAVSVIQFPVLFLVTRLVNLTGYGWDERIGNVSVGGWILVLTTAASYVQWWLVALTVRFSFSVRR